MEKNVFEKIMSVPEAIGEFLGLGGTSGGHTGSGGSSTYSDQASDYYIDPRLFRNPMTSPFSSVEEQTAWENRRAAGNTADINYARKAFSERLQNDPEFAAKYQNMSPEQQKAFFQAFMISTKLGSGLERTFTDPQLYELPQSPINRVEELAFGDQYGLGEPFRDLALQGPDNQMFLDYMSGAGQFEAPLMSEYNPMTAAQLDTALTDVYRGYEGQTRGEQLASLGLLGAAARGEAPSQAEIQMQIGLDRAAQEQMALANSARGGIGASMLAQRNAANQGALMQQAGIREQAALRANEMAAARQGYMTGATGLRANDITATGLAQDAAIQNALLSQEAQKFNRQQQTQREIADIDSKLRAQGLNVDESAKMINAYLDKLGIDRDQKRTYLDTWLQSRGMDITERQGYLNTMTGTAQTSMAGGLGQAGIASDVFMQGVGLDAAATEAAKNREVQNRAATMGALGTILSFIPTVSGSGGGTPTNTNTTPTSSTSGGSSMSSTPNPAIPPNPYY